MSDINQLTAKNQALESESVSLKGVIEQINAEKQALDQTVVELLRANILFKAGANLLEKRYAVATAELGTKNAEIQALKDKIVALEEAQAEKKPKAKA